MPGCEEEELSSAAAQDVVWCKVESQGLMQGDSVSFTLYLKGPEGSADVKLTTEIGRVGEGRDDEAAVSKWVVPVVADKRSLVPKKDRFYFVAKRYLLKVEAKSPLLPLAPAFTPYRFSW